MTRIFDIGLWAVGLRPATISDVTTVPLIQLSDRREGRRRPRRPIARRHPQRGGGRVWINGREAGGADARYAHLGRTYD